MRVIRAAGENILFRSGVPDLMEWRRGQTDANRTKSICSRRNYHERLILQRKQTESGCSCNRKYSKSTLSLQLERTLDPHAQGRVPEAVRDIVVFSTEVTVDHFAKVRLGK